MVHMASHESYDYHVAACGVSERDEPVLNLKGFVDCLDELPEDCSPCTACLLVAREALTLLKHSSIT
jgi:hypothetical protein